MKTERRCTVHGGWLHPADRLGICGRGWDADHVADCVWEDVYVIPVKAVRRISVHFNGRWGYLAQVGVIRDLIAVTRGDVLVVEADDD